MMHSLLPRFVANIVLSDIMVANVVNAPGELLRFAAAINFDGVDVIITLTW
jgi:hypothetical protein